MAATAVFSWHDLVVTKIDVFCWQVFPHAIGPFSFSLPVAGTIMVEEKDPRPWSHSWLNFGLRGCLTTMLLCTSIVLTSQPAHGIPSTKFQKASYLLQYWLAYFTYEFPPVGY